MRAAVSQGEQARASALALLFTKGGSGTDPAATVDVTRLPPLDGGDDTTAVVLAAQQSAHQAFAALRVVQGLQRRVEEAAALRWLAAVLGWAYKVRP